MSIVGRMLTCPPGTPGRQAEGGLRTQGQYKRRKADGAANPLVTVITVCLNSARTLEQCLRSVAEQTYDNLEHVVVDGASSDGTLEILQRHAHGIAYFVSEPDAGLYDAMNKGLALAAGDYILILNSDDWYVPDCIETLVRASSCGDASVVAALAQLVDADGRPLERIRHTDFDASAYLRMPLRHETMLVPAAVYDAIGPYDIGYPVIADRKFVAALFQGGYTVYEVPQPLLCFRNDGISNSQLQRLFAERARLVKEHFPFLEDQEAALFADLQCLVPTALVPLAAKYRQHTDFYRALHAYCSDGAEDVAAQLALPLEPHAPATLRSVVTRAQAVREAALVCRHLFQPGERGTGSRHGGLRTTGKYKQRAVKGKRPLVSVITVCLNAGRTLEQCMRSVFAQSYDNLEYIVIDGGSTDGTLDLIRKHEERIDYWLSEPDGGLYQAMNKGLALASGDEILILNADDWYATDCVESLVKAKGYGCADFVAALAQYVDDSGAPVELMRHMPLDDSALMRMPLRHESMLVPAALYERVGGYDESYRISADFHFVTRLYRAGCTVYELQRPLLYFRNTGVSNSNAALELAERVRVIRDGFPFLSEREATILADVRRLTPAQVVEVATAHPDRGQLLHTLLAYVRYRRRVAPRSPWGECERSWPEAALAHPRISVILPVYNGQATLQACIESVLAQSFGDFELICLDDLSTDASWQILTDYQARDPRVIALKNDVNLGHGGARNRGVRLARGAYVFHVDPDDTIPGDALEALYRHAQEHGCDIVKGAYWRERQHFERADKAAAVVKPRRDGAAPAGLRLAQVPQLLNSTEGHWSCLYRRDVARQVPYGADLRMGEDSIFVVRALLQAENIGLIDKVVYRYQANPSSAMNTFTHRKYMDGIEFRRRAWHVLADAGLKAIGERILRAYWRDSFFSDFAGKADAGQFRELCLKLRAAFAEAGITSAAKQSSGYLRRIFSAMLAGEDDEARRLMQEGAQPRTPSSAPRRLRIATFCSLDHGGAGTGSHRRIEALRAHGIDARLFSLFVKRREDYVKRVIPKLPGLDSPHQRDVWEEAKSRALLRPGQMPGSRAREMFSLADGVVDFRTLEGLLDHFDVAHLHWVVGLFDYRHGGEVLADKPVVWTLADMNAFTGGCHYSEGCEEYKRQCRRCPMLSADSDLAHENWKAKRRAYRQIKNLHVVCPSPWMAERARESSLLGDRPIHCIPNAYPVARFAMTAKPVARLQLGLPLRKKLLLFGAENVNNHRKGGDLLAEAVRRFCAAGPHDGVEVVVFGRHSLDIELPVHSMGYIKDDEKLALVYSAADAYLFPSREDNAPLTVGEALLCGAPVVAFPVGNVPALVEHEVTGYIARSLDVEDFARGIRWALGATPAAALARSARCRLSAAALHDPAAAAQRHEAVYRLALGEAA